MSPLGFKHSPETIDCHKKTDTYGVNINKI